MKTFSKLKLWPMTLLLVLVFAVATAIAFTSVGTATDTAYANGSEETVTVDMPASLSQTNTSEFTIKLYVEVHITGVTASRMTVNFNYPVDQVEYVGYEYPDPNWQQSSGVAPSHNATTGKVTVVLTGFGGTPSEITSKFNFITYKFKLKSGVSGGSNVVFGFDKFSLPLSNRPAKAPNTSDGTLELPTMSIAITAPSTDNFLTGLTLSNVTLSPAFNKATTSYTASVPYATSSTKVTASLPSGATATITNKNSSGTSNVTNGGTTNLVKGTNTITITVKPESTLASNTIYSVVVTRQEGDSSAALSTIKISKSGREINGTLSGSTYSFGTEANPLIAYKDRGGWTLTVTAEKSTTTVALNSVSGSAQTKTLYLGDNPDSAGNNNRLSYSNLITVTPQDGTAVKYSVIVYIASPETRRTLSSLSIMANGSEVAWTSAFTPDTFDYTVNIPNDITKLAVNAVAAGGDLVTVTGDVGSEVSIVGKTSLSITVTPEYGSTGTYHINISKVSSDSGIYSFMVNDVGAILNGSTYTANLSYKTLEATLSITVGDGATVTTQSGLVFAKTNNTFVTNVASLKEGANNDTVYVTSQAGAVTEYSLVINRAYGDKDTTLASNPKLVIDGETTPLALTANGTTFTVNDTIDYVYHDQITLTVETTSTKVESIKVDGSPMTLSGNIGTYRLNLHSGNNALSITVQTETGDVGTYSLVVNVVQARADTSLLADPIVCNGGDELHLLTIIPSETYMVRYPANINALTVIAIATDNSATVSVIAVSETNETPIGGKTYKSEEEITLVEGMNRFIVTVTAQNDESKTYKILLSPYTVHSDDEVPDEEKFITLDFGEIEIGEDDSKMVGIDREEFQTSYTVKKGTTTATFSVKIKGEATIEVLYGASLKEENEPQELVAYAAEITEDGVLQKYKVDLVEGNNPIVFKVNETGIVGADEIYVLDIYRPVEQEKFNKAGWIAGIVILAVLFVVAVVLLILFLLGVIKLHPDDGNEENKEEPTETEEPTDANPIEEEVVPVEEPTPTIAPVEEPAPTIVAPIEETAPIVQEETAPVAKEPIEEPITQEKTAPKEVVEVPVEVVESENKAQEAPAEEVPAEEVSPIAPVINEAIEGNTESEQEDREYLEEGSIQIKNVQSHKEKYDMLSREQKTFYDELKLRALALPGSMLTLNKNNEIIRLGQKRIIKLTIRRDMVVACFYPENDSVSGLKKEFRGKSVKINTKETEIPIQDVNAFNAAKELLQMIIESVYNRK